MRYRKRGGRSASSLSSSPDSLKGFFRRRPSQLREQWPPLLSPLLAIPKNPRLDHLQSVNTEFITLGVVEVQCIIKVSKQREKGDDTDETTTWLILRCEKKRWGVFSWWALNGFASTGSSRERYRKKLIMWRDTVTFPNIETATDLFTLTTLYFGYFQYFKGNPCLRRVRVSVGVCERTSAPSPCAASVMGNESRRTLRCRNVVNFNAVPLLSLRFGMGRRASVVLTD